MKRDLSNSKLELCELDDKEADNNSRLLLLLSLFINFNHQLIQSSYLHAFLSKSLGLQKIFSYLAWCLVVDISLSLYIYICMYVCVCTYSALFMITILLLPFGIACFEDQVLSLKVV